MRSKVMLVAALLAAAALVPAGAAAGKPQVFSLIDIEVSETPIDPGSTFDQIPRAGARFAFTDALYAWAGVKRGARVGRVEGLCTFVKVDTAQFAATVYCTAEAYLPAGQILLSGFIRFAENSGPTFRIAITGGVGRYRGARGYVKITSIGGEESGKNNMEFHLLP
jgi:hypothetical protein